MLGRSSTASYLIRRRSRRLSFRLEENDADDDPTEMTEKLHSYFRDTYNACPTFFIGTLDEPLKERSMLNRLKMFISLFVNDEINLQIVPESVHPALIFIRNGVCSLLFLFENLLQ